MRIHCALVSFVLAAILVNPALSAEIRVISPGVISNSGLSDVAAAFTNQTGVKVTIVVDGMGSIMNDIRTKSPPADVVMLPMDLMGTLSLEEGIVPTSFTPLGRVEMGLFAKPGAPHRDITSVRGLVAAMKGASAVFYTDPASGSMQAGMSDRMFHRPEFSGIHAVPIKGDAEPALKRGEGDANAMGVGLIHGVHSPDNAATSNPYLVGMLPKELGMHMDMATGISVRSLDEKDAAAFIQFAVSPEMRAVWKAKGVDRY